jgi:hypothetical protein
LETSSALDFEFFFNFSPSSPAYGTIYRITGGSLKAATSILKRVSEGSSKLVSVFMEASKNLNFHFLHNKAPKKI